MNAALAVLCLLALQAGKTVRTPSEDEIRKMTDAAPERPSVPPAKPRKLLVVAHNPSHDPVAYCSKALEIMGKKTGAFEAVVTDDGSFFEPDRLREFDAVVANNWHGFDPFLPLPRKEFNALPAERKAELQRRQARLRQSLLDFVAGGKGLVGIHAATVGLNDWKEWGELIGARYVALPWMETLVRVEEPDHPLCATFKGRPTFRVADEIYEFREPYSRAKLRVLLSVDPGETGREKSTRYGKPVRTDGDYALAWVRSHGKGRVFYSAFGHLDEIYWNPLLLMHFLDGIQFALGDLPADAEPRAAPAK